MKIVFEWDETKNNENKNKHNLSFEEAAKVFDDNESVKKSDTRKDYGEDRFIIIGAIFKGIIFVVYTIRNGINRIISARKANNKERYEYYENQLKK